MRDCCIAMAAISKKRSFGTARDGCFEETFVAAMAEVLVESSTGQVPVSLATTWAWLPFPGAHGCVGLVIFPKVVARVCGAVCVAGCAEGTRVMWSLDVWLSQIDSDNC